MRVELPALDDFESISIVDNAVLEAVPHYTTSRGTFVPPAAGVDPTGFRLSLSSFEVGDKPQLKSIVLPTDSSDIEQVAIRAAAGSHPLPRRPSRV